MGQAARVFGVLAAILGVGAGVVVWLLVSPFQAVWPLPGLYLIEVAVLAVAAALVTFLGGPLAVPVLGLALGATVVFAVLGALSVGFLYVPGAILLLAAGALYVGAAGRRVTAYLLWFVAGALVQGIVIVVAIQFVGP